MLELFGPCLYCADGPTVSFFGFPYPTRMAVVRLSDGSSWVWSPIALTEQLAAEVCAVGPIRYIVTPNKLHHLFLEEWAKRWPDAHLYAPPGLARKKPELRFEAELAAEFRPPWTHEIDHVVFRGSAFLEEVVFFHRASHTAIVGDLIQRLPKSTMAGFKGVLARLGGIVGERGSTPLDWRSSFWQRGRARDARSLVLGWNAQKMPIAHGACAQTHATEIIASALSWM